WVFERSISELESLHNLARQKSATTKLSPASADQIPPTVVFGGSGALTGGIGTGGMFGANEGCSRRYSASEIAPMPQRATMNPAQPPMNGRLVITRTAATPTTMRRKNGQNSSLRPIIHWPTIPPTAIPAANSITSQSISEESPTNMPTIVMQAMIEAINTPKKTSTPRPNDAPRCPAESTVSIANLGINPANTKPNRTNAPVQITRHT